MEEQVNNTKSELWSLSLRDLFYKYVRFLPVFVLSVAIALFGSYAYLRYATPIFSTSGTLIIKGEQQGGRDKFSEIFGGSQNSNIQSEIEVLRSRGLMTRVVRKLGLQYSYHVKGKIKTLNLYNQGPFYVESIVLVDSMQPFTLKIKINDDGRFRVNDDNTLIGFGNTFRNKFGTFKLVRRPSAPFAKDYTVEYKPTHVAASEFASLVSVAPKSVGSGILNISLRSDNPVLASDIVNQLMDEYSDYTKELKNITADSTLSFIDNRLAVLGKELDSVQNLLLRYSQENNLIDIEVQSNSYFENISEADRNMNQQYLQLNIVELIEGYLRDKRNQYGQLVVPSSLGLDDGTLNVLVNSYNTLQLQRQQLLDGGVPEGNPLVRENKEQVEKLRQSILENVSNIKNSYTRAIGLMKENSSQSQAQLMKLPYKAKEFNEIKRQVENKQAVFNILQEKKEETSISRASTMGNAQIVERASVPSVPIKPKPRSIQLMAVLVGIALPALFVFAGEVLNDKVSTRFDIEKITTAPILGEVGHSYSENVLIVNKTTRSMVAEQFRIIRSNLQYVIGKKEKFALLVTSSFSGEGKSFLSTNVGAVLALTGKKTIILELDIRKPKVLSGLNMPKGPGITNYLVGKADNLAELIQQVPEYDNLFVLGCGPIPPNPSELLLGPRVNEMFTWVREHYDMVIIDTAPVGMVSDAMTLSIYADATLYLVRQGHTFKKQIMLIDEFYRENKLPKVSIIINDVKMKAGYGYYGYGRYGYGYGYGYGSYYEEEHPPKNFLERALNFMDVTTFFKSKKSRKPKN